MGMKIEKMPSHFLLFTFVLAIYLHQVFSLYEDQVGTYDWRQQFVGRPKLVKLDNDGHSSKRILVATERNVVASLNAKTGDIGWRQIFENTDSGRVDDITLSKNYLVSVSGQGQNLRCFSSATGNLVWEHLDDTPVHTRSVLSLVGTSEDAVALLSGGNLKIVTLETGEVKWRKQLPNSDVVQYRYLFAIEDNLLVVGISPNSHISLNTYHEGGILKSQTSIPAAWTTTDTSCVLVGGAQLVCLDSRSSTLQSLSLADPKAFKTTLLQDLSLNPTHASLIDIQLEKSDEENNLPVFGLRLSQTHVALLSAEKSGIKVIKDLPGATALQVLQSGNKQVLVAFHHKPTGSEVHFYDVALGTDLLDTPAITLDFPGHHGLPEQMFIMTFRKKDGNTGYRVLVLSEDHSLALIQQSGRISWTREEALSSLVAVEMVDLPVSPLLAKMEDEFGHTSNDDILALFLKRFATQFSQIKDFLFLLKNKLRTPRHSHQRHLEEMEEDDEEDVDDEEYLTRDEFNLHKMIVVVSSAGKVFGIDNLTGKLLWRRYLSDISPFTKFGQETLVLLVQRTTAHFPHNPICTVIGKNKITGQGLLFSFDPITGEPAGDTPPGGLTVNYSILQLTMLPQLDEHFQHPLVMLDTNLEYHVYPESAKKIVLELVPVFYLFTTDVDAGVLNGYGMTHSEGDKLMADKLWSVSLLKDQQTITNVVPKRPAEHVHSQGIVLGDRSVMYKYLNPNLAVVTTEGVDSTQKSFLNLYLVDVVTGHIVFQCSHKKAKGPMRVVHSENWVVYTYWNQKLRRNEIAVLEMYEGKKQSNATAFSSLSPPPAPLVMRQAYIFPGYISNMAATITEKGITNKHILMALETGGILELPKALLDPRRPEVLTQEHKEEGIMPYIPELPRPFEATINYNQTVYNIRGIHTSPAGLESTSLVLCYGLDLFYTRVTPSKMFDVLKEDFDYFFISSVLIGMIAVSVLTQKLAGRKALNRAWK